MRLVYVEDEPDIQKVARISLEKVGGFDVTIFSSGDEALNGINDLTPDFILLDVMMPGMSGEELYHEIRKLEKFKEIPIIFITAKTSSDMLKRLVDMGALAVITKPFDPMKLPDQIRDILKDNK